MKTKNGNFFEPPKIWATPDHTTKEMKEESSVRH